MTQGFVPLRSKVLNVLVDSGTWVSRGELDMLTTCGPALDDALADLVVEKLAEHRPNIGYRLATTEPARRAAQLQRRTGKRLAAVGVPGKDFYSVGVAETRPDLGLLLYELAIPNPDPGPGALQRHLEQVQGVIDFINARGGQHA